MFEIRDHPDAPDLEELGEFLMEPVDPEEIAARRDDGDELLEVNLLEHDAVDAHVYLDDSEPNQPGRSDDIGTALYRLVQLFGTPPFEEFQAGRDISWRENETFKYLFEVSRRDGDDEWLVTVFDHHVRLGVGLAAWASDSGGEPPTVDPEEAIALLALVTNVVTEPVFCEYEEVPY